MSYSRSFLWFHKTKKMLTVLVLSSLFNATRISEEIKHSWDAYARFAAPYDTLNPIKRAGFDNFGGISITAIDSMSTLWVAGHFSRFEEAYRLAISIPIEDNHNEVNVFETNIRAIGGLLSAYALTSRSPLLDVCTRIANRLVPALVSHAIPLSQVRLSSSEPSTNKAFYISVAEVGTLSLEFNYLSYLTNNDTYSDVVRMLQQKIYSKMSDYEYLLPISLDAKSGESIDSSVSLGAGGDSMYEYLLKAYLQNRSDVQSLSFFRNAVQSMRDNLFLQLSHHSRVFVAELTMGGLHVFKMDHLVCFLPGLLTLAIQEGVIDTSYWSIANGILNVCMDMYSFTTLKLAPEIVKLNQMGKLSCSSQDRHNLLRPEAVESLYIMYKYSKM